MHLTLEGVGKTFAGVAALEDISFTAVAPEFVCLLGPSGCGKTTLAAADRGIGGGR